MVALCSTITMKLCLWSTVTSVRFQRREQKPKRWRVNLGIPWGLTIFFPKNSVSSFQEISVHVRSLIKCTALCTRRVFGRICKTKSIRVMWKISFPIVVNIASTHKRKQDDLNGHYYDGAAWPSLFWFR